MHFDINNIEMIEILYQTIDAKWYGHQIDNDNDSDIGFWGRTKKWEYIVSQLSLLSYVTELSVSPRDTWWLLNHD